MRPGGSSGFPLGGGNDGGGRENDCRGGSRTAPTVAPLGCWNDGMSLVTHRRPLPQLHVHFNGLPVSQQRQRHRIARSKAVQMHHDILHGRHVIAVHSRDNVTTGLTAPGPVRRPGRPFRPGSPTSQSICIPPLRFQVPGLRRCRGSEPRRLCQSRAALPSHPEQTGP